jgi:ABC-2 type transport system permease protein
MRRRGSPWKGAGIVIAKETADHLSGALIVLIEALVFLAALGTIYVAIRAIRATIGESPFLFLHLMTVSQSGISVAGAELPSFVGLVGFLIPILGIALGFDTVNSEFNRRTLSRILSQPIYRDALMLGKFLAGLLTLSIGLVSLWLLVIGLGLVFFGLPPSTEETVRMLGFLVAMIAYGGVWLSVSMLFSVLFRAPATAVLASFGLWLLLTVFWGYFPPIIATLIAGSPHTVGGAISYFQTVQAVDRISPNTLFTEIGAALLSPTTHGFGLLSALNARIEGTLPTPLPMGQSFMLIWPQLIGLVATMVGFFVVAYIAFQRQEIRA